jgi:hypothetical protein
MSTIINDSITTSNKKILDFYKKNAHINFEYINCLLVDILENIVTKSPESNIKNTISEEFAEFLNKNNSSHSSMFGENKLCYILNRIFPSSYIENTPIPSNFILKRNNSVNILFENKQCTFNVPTIDVNNFIKSCDENNLSGIMISNTSGIATKNNFQIDINDKHVLIYLHNANYNEDIIHTAVDVLDYLTNTITNIDPSNISPLTNEQLLDINQEFQTFLNQKETIINYIRDTNKKLIQTILDIELPTLHKYLSSKFASTNTIDLKCNICEKFTGKNNKSIASHKKTCSTKTSDDNEILNNKRIKKLNVNKSPIASSI